MNDAMDNSNPLVTVGIPTFNRPGSLRRVLNCICHQTYPNLEIIVSDNASPGSETRRVIDECMARDARIRYFCQSSNIGAIANFQFVLDAASGEFFLWMSDDDWRSPSYIDVLLRELQATSDAVLAFCDIAVLDEQGRRRDDFYSTYLPYLKQFTSQNRLIRLTKFFLQDESFGKANLIFGLIRSGAIKGISLSSMLELYGFFALDNLFVFTLLEKGKLKLVDEMLYGCTAGNIKYYPTTVNTGFKGRLLAMVEQIKYLLVYPKLASGAVRFVFILIFPVKLVLYYWHVARRKISIVN
jgi:glycosyltransferase involved in cell wall biosynthesis